MIKVFENVGFAYNSGETVLKDVSFTAKQGEVTALIGPSGAVSLPPQSWQHGFGMWSMAGSSLAAWTCPRLTRSSF